MKAGKTISQLAGRSGSRLAGWIALLLAVSYVAGGITPAYAVETPPEMPHQFYGTVTYNYEPVQPGTLVEAFVNDVKQADTTVDSSGRYGYSTIFRVPGTAGARVTFKIGGVLANETATWESGKVQELHLTINEPPGGATARYTLTMAADPAVGGDAIDQTGLSPYAAGTAVSIKAVAKPGYGFVAWTAPAGSFADATNEQTTFIMPSQNVTATARFGVAYQVLMAADPVGSGVATDVAGKGAYAANATVRIRAQPATGYGFVRWTADAPVTFADATAPETTFTMPAQAVTIIGQFGAAYGLTMAVNPAGAGNAIDVAGKGAYAANATVTVRAVANPGYAFGNWTASPAVTFANATAAQTTFTMPAQPVAITAQFYAWSPPANVPTVTTLPATGISSYAASIHMSYTLGDRSSVEVRFACKRPTDPTWFYTSWVPKTADGNYTEVLTSLIAQTNYEFKAQLRYDTTVIEGSASQFATTGGSDTGLDDLLGYFGCFIATAAYGTSTAEQINVLREFRDLVLLNNTVGSKLVTLYYQLSPPVADFIAGNEVLRALTRELLVDPLVWMVQAAEFMWRN